MTNANKSAKLTAKSGSKSADTSKVYNGTHDSGADFVNGSKLTENFNKHKLEFGYITEQQYLNGAKNFLEKNPTSATQAFTSNPGWYFRYDTATNEFGIINEFGGISTYMKPDLVANPNYWIDQVINFSP